MAPQTGTKNLCPTVVIRKMEEASGSRYCKTCDKLLPLDMFDISLRNHRFLCTAHTKESYHTWAYGTKEKRAFSTFKAKLQADRKLFGQDHVEIKKKHMVSLVTKEQLANAGEWCIVPRRPDVPISGDNAVMVTIYMRRCLIKKWKSDHDPAQYAGLLERLLEHCMELHTGLTSKPE
jgi:hypothetical protein